MPFLVNATKAATDRMPKLLSPRAHAVADYATAAMFLLYGVRQWPRNRAASISALMCGMSEAMVAASTDYPGGIFRRISFEAHGRIDAGLALLAAALPGMMNFADEPEARFFNLQAVAMAGVTGLTDFKRTGETRQLRDIRKKAA